MSEHWRIRDYIYTWVWENCTLMRCSSLHLSSFTFPGEQESHLHVPLLRIPKQKAGVSIIYSKRATKKLRQCTQKQCNVSNPRPTATKRGEKRRGGWGTHTCGLAVHSCSQLGTVLPSSVQRKNPGEEQVSIFFKFNFLSLFVTAEKVLGCWVCIHPNELCELGRRRAQLDPNTRRYTPSMCSIRISSNKNCMVIFCVTFKRGDSQAHFTYLPNNMGAS